MEPGQTAVLDTAHGVISPELVQALYSDNVKDQLESTQRFRKLLSRFEQESLNVLWSS